MRLKGTLDIVRYNAPIYMAGCVVVALGAAAGLLVQGPVGRVVLICAGAAAWWLVASLAVSYWVYDATDTLTFDWLPVGAPRTWINLHAGVDESTPSLARRIGPPAAVYDFFCASQMTEPSIRRARALATNEVAAVPADYRLLPVDSESVDLVTVVFAAHELRSADERDAFFAELFRVLRPGGRLVVVEHLRDLANFVAFGPGFLHFLPRSEWLRVTEDAGFPHRLASVTRHTPFVASFTMEKP